MSSFVLRTFAVAALALTTLSTAAAQGTSVPGIWTLNRALSQQPKEMGFDPDWLQVPRSGGSQAPSGTGGRGGRGGGGNRGGTPSGGAVAGSRESYDDSQRLQLLTAEARNPPPRLLITETPTALTITDDQGHARTLAPAGVQRITVQDVALVVTTSRSADQYVLLYDVERDRKLRWTYSRVANPPQLTVDIEFVDHGTVHDKARLVYEPATDLPSPSSATLTTTAPAAPPPNATGKAAELFDQRPGAELKGLKSLGIVVEDLSAQTIACGLNQNALETAVSQRLSAGGLTVRRNSDDDTYLYVNIKTVQLTNGACLSRYDASLYTHATAKLSYGERPALVLVELMHRGGISSGAAGSHATAVTRDIESDVDLFVTQVRDANR